MANQKLTQEELQSIAELQQRNNAIVAEFGQIELAKMNLDARRANAESFLADVRRTETELVTALNEKYGVGTIDLQNGEFLPAEEVEAPVEEETAE